MAWFNLLYKTLALWLKWPCLCTINQTTIFIFGNPTFYECMKHVEINFYLIWNKYDIKGFITTLRVPSLDQMANIFPKCITRKSYDHLGTKLSCLIYMLHDRGERKNMVHLGQPIWILVSWGISLCLLSSLQFTHACNLFFNHPLSNASLFHTLKLVKLMDIYKWYKMILVHSIISWLWLYICIDINDIINICLYIWE